MDCKRNEVDVPKVVGSPLEDAQLRLASMPLEAEVISRPAEPGERLGIVVAQYPKAGTLSSLDTVKIVVPKPTHGVAPRVVGLTLARARARLAKRSLGSLVDSFVTATGIRRSGRGRLAVPEGRAGPQGRAWSSSWS